MGVHTRQCTSSRRSGLRRYDAAPRWEAPLHLASVETDFDDDEDGSVDMVDSPFSSVSIGSLGDPGTVAEAQINVMVAIAGDSPAPDTPYEWAVVVADAGGLASEPFVFPCRTPREDGTGGG